MQIPAGPTSPFAAAAASRRRPGRSTRSGTDGGGGARAVLMACMARETEDEQHHAQTQYTTAVPSTIFSFMIPTDGFVMLQVGHTRRMAAALAAAAGTARQNLYAVLRVPTNLQSPPHAQCYEIARGMRSLDRTLNCDCAHEQRPGSGAAGGYVWRIRTPVRWNTNAPNFNTQVLVPLQLNTQFVADMQHLAVAMEIWNRNPYVCSFPLLAIVFCGHLELLLFDKAMTNLYIR